MEIVVPEEFRDLYQVTERVPVVKIPHPALREKAKPVEKISKKTIGLMDEMIRIMKRADGIGLAAPQIAISQRIIVIAPKGMKPTALINPVVIEASGTQTLVEGCLSIPGLYGEVTRPSEVVVEAIDRKGKRVVYEFTGMPATVVQHEIDHLDGVLFIDKVDPTTLSWERPDGSSNAAE